jgi:hypothetical protein
MIRKPTTAPKSLFKYSVQVLDALKAASVFIDSSTNIAFPISE